MCEPVDEKKALELLGLAMRAGQVTSGDGMAEGAVRAGRAGIVLIDTEVSDNTRGKYAAMCQARGVSLHEVSADALGQAIGKPNRMVAVVAPGPLAKKVAALLAK